MSAITSLMHQSMLLSHPLSSETPAPTRRARDYCDCYALLSLVRLLVLAPFGGKVLVDHKRRETGTIVRGVAGAELVPAPS
jgi:hypothetical protein